jgi:predicted anti-sigma-YlaC factor YlaD
MNCRHIQKKLSALQDGELNADEKIAVSAHLQSCPDCRRVYDEMEEVWQSLGMINEIEPSPQFNRNLYWKIHTSANQQQQSVAPWFLQLLPTPAVTLAFLLISITLGAFLGNAIVAEQPWSIGHQTSSSQAIIDVDSLKVFSPIPPDTLGNGYLIMASATEEYSK